jgi:hypothetical protein
MGTTGCVLKADLACNSTDSGCVDSTHAVVCNSDGMGFKSVTCPTGTTCQSFGTCVGSCVVGSSRCSGTGIVQTCMDGFTYTDTDCMPGTTSCVGTSSPSAIIQTAACKPMGCSATSAVCGDKAADPNNTDVNYASTCVSSPAGMHWQSEQCALPGSCLPGSGCTQQCVPGAQRCNGLGIQTCNTNSVWGTITACQPTATGAEQTCQVPSGAITPICGDPVCASYPGACEADGYHPCSNGKVSTSPQACTMGVCVGSGNVYNGLTGGSCQAQCNVGDSRCDGNEAYQICTSNHTWSSTVTNCPVNGTDACVSFTDPASGGGRTLCGVCAPGTHRCTDTAGVSGATGTDIETCDTTGHWGPHGACSVGGCQYQGGDYACAAACFPGSTVCMGAAPVTAPNPTHPGTVNWGMCDTNGNLPTNGGTACTSGTSCRRGPDGQPVGVGAAACVTCVGSDIPQGNESGDVDGFCTTGTTLETCTSTNQWSAAAACPNTAPAYGSCKQEGTAYCNGYYACTNSYLTSIGYTNGCASYWGTGFSAWGGTPDCCAVSYCQQTNGIPGPAACQ